MSFETTIRKAAKAADKAVRQTLRAYRNDEVHDEDDINPFLAGQLSAEMERVTGGVKWSCSILRHRKGRAAEEKEIGADMLIHVRFDTLTLKYSKGVLVQSKRAERDQQMTPRDHNTLVGQCEKMLNVTPAAFVFDYTRHEIRAGSALKVADSPSRVLYDLCDWTSYRFFLELFRCPIGDRRINSARVDRLPVPLALVIVGKGEIEERVKS